MNPTANQKEIKKSKKKHSKYKKETMADEGHNSKPRPYKA